MPYVGQLITDSSGKVQVVEKVFGDNNYVSHEARPEELANRSVPSGSHSNSRNDIAVAPSKELKVLGGAPAAQDEATMYQQGYTYKGQEGNQQIWTRYETPKAPGKYTSPGGGTWEVSGPVTVSNSGHKATFVGGVSSYEGKPALMRTVPTNMNENVNIIGSNESKFLAGTSNLNEAILNAGQNAVYAGKVASAVAPVGILLPIVSQPDIQPILAGAYYATTKEGQEDVLSFFKPLGPAKAVYSFGSQLAETGKEALSGNPTAQFQLLSFAAPIVAGGVAATASHVIPRGIDLLKPEFENLITREHIVIPSRFENVEVPGVSKTVTQKSTIYELSPLNDMFSSVGAKGSGSSLFTGKSMNLIVEVPEKGVPTTKGVRLIEIGDFEKGSQLISDMGVKTSASDAAKTAQAIQQADLAIAKRLENEKIAIGGKIIDIKTVGRDIYPTASLFTGKIEPSVTLFEKRTVTGTVVNGETVLEPLTLKTELTRGKISEKGARFSEFKNFFATTSEVSRVEKRTSLLGDIKASEKGFTAPKEKQFLIEVVKGEKSDLISKRVRTDNLITHVSTAKEKEFSLTSEFTKPYGKANTEITKGVTISKSKVVPESSSLLDFKKTSNEMRLAREAYDMKIANEMEERRKVFDMRPQVEKRESSPLVFEKQKLIEPPTSKEINPAVKTILNRKEPPIIVSYTKTTKTPATMKRVMVSPRKEITITKVYENRVPFGYNGRNKLGIDTRQAAIGSSLLKGGHKVGSESMFKEYSKSVSNLPHPHSNYAGTYAINGFENQTRNKFSVQPKTNEKLVTRQALIESAKTKTFVTQLGRQDLGLGQKASTKNDFLLKENQSLGLRNNVKTQIIERQGLRERQELKQQYRTSSLKFVRPSYSESGFKEPPPPKFIKNDEDKTGKSSLFGSQKKASPKRKYAYTPTFTGLFAKAPKGMKRPSTGFTGLEIRPQ